MIQRRALKWFLGTLIGLIGAIVVAVALFNWNWLREPIARQVTRATGRPFAIQGDLIVHLALQPRVTAHDLVMGNAPWASTPTLATVKRLDVTIKLWPLLRGEVHLPAIALSQADVDLEVGPDGTPNWLLGVATAPATPPRSWPTLGELRIDQGRARFRNANINTDLTLTIATRAAASEGSEGSLDVSGKGRFKGLPTSFQAQGGAILSIRSADRPYPIKASAELGSTKASIDGFLLDPLHLRGEQLNFQIAGSDLALLYPIVGVPIPPTPAYKLAGFLDHAADLWTFRGFKGTVGRSDMAGDFSVDRSTRPQMIRASIVSKKLVLQDFSGFIGGSRAGDARSRPPAGRVLPAAPFNLDKLRAANADVRFRGEQLLTGTTALEKMSAHLIVDNGTLKLAPLDFGVAGGHLVLRVDMDGRGARMATRADISARGLRLARLLPTAALTRANSGLMGGRARLAGQGNSLAQMLATAEGEAALIMDGGSISELLLRLSNLDLANALGVLVGGDEQVPIRCMVADFKAVAGDFKVSTLLLDTPKVNIAGTGNVNFADESLHLRLMAQSKSFSLASLRGPIGVTGTFKTPVVRPEANEALVRAGLAVALGAVTGGVGTLLPLLDFGKDQTSNCGALVRQTKAQAGVKASDLKPQPAAPARR